MNQIFCLKRYVGLLKRQWFENATGYKLGIALMALMVGGIYGLFLWISFNQNLVGQNISEMISAVQIGLFAATGLLFLYVYSSKFFGSLVSKNRKMFYFSLPVSTFEKVVVAFTFVVVLLPVLILIVFNVFDFITVQLFNQIHGTSVQMFFKTPAPFNSFGLMFMMILSYLSYASVFVLGSLMFGKKGPDLSIVFFIVFVSFYAWLKSYFGLHQKIYDAGNSMFIIDFIENWVFIYLLPICWTAMYFVMKRKEA